MRVIRLRYAVGVRLCWVVLGSVLMCVLPARDDASAQIGPFGKNKVQYARLDWQVMKSEHFDLHFYPEERRLADVALALAESSYAALAVKFRHEIPEPIPLVIYSAHSYFEQTNIIPQLLPEGVAGFTDYMRSRVALPFNGSYADFRRILQHELVHAFQISRLDRTYRLHPRTSYMMPPLWFTEGLAEYWSRSWDSEGDMVLADLVLNGNLPDIPDLWQLGMSFSVYKVGQSLVAFIAANYGEETPALIYELIWTARSFVDLLETVCGVPAEEINSRWKDDIRRTYFPTVRTREALEERFRPVTEGGLDLKPTPIPQREGEFLFISAHRGYSAIYFGSLDRPDAKEWLKGGSSSEFEQFHLFGSRMDVSADGRVAFVSRTQGRDALYIYDVRKGKRLARRQFRELVALSSPTWSPDGSRLIFAALTADGYSDLFLWDADRDELSRLTQDPFLDQDPDWSPDGRWIVFSSDRTPYGEGGATNLFLMDFPSRRILYLTAGDWVDRSPRWDENGTQIAFTSDRAGRHDLYVVDREGSGRRLSCVQTQVADPEWLPGRGGWLVTGYENYKFRIFHLPGPPDSCETVETIALCLPEVHRTWAWPEDGRPERVEIHRYRPDFSLEVAQGGVAFGPYQTIGQGLQAALADLLGDRLLYMQLANTARTSSEFLSRFNVGVAFVNLSGRANWGMSVFHTTGDFLDELGYPYFKRETGAGLLMTFPFSKFSRLESGVTAMYAERDHLAAPRSHGLMVANYLAWVHDTSLWFPSGPMDGSRWRLAGGFTMNARTVEAESGFLVADLRRYFRLSLRTALAFRVVGRAAAGANPERSILGGPLTLRGYDWRAIYGTRSLLLNGEIRFPFVEGFVLDFPLGGLHFPGFQGVAFVDAGNAWEKDEPMPDLIGSVGVGFRMALGAFMVLRLDLARRTDFHTISDHTEKQFFIGWNY